ncbi:MAG: TlpA disulfide reductase family protein, partial [Thermomonas sp.]
LVALVAGIAGVGASMYVDPSLAQRLAGTEPGQEVLAAVMQAQAPKPPEGVIVAERGGIVPDMTLSEADGTNIEVPKAWVGKVTLVNLWATWCAPCLKEMPDLQVFADEQGADGVQVVGIALDDVGAVRDFMRQRRIRYPTLVDAPGPADAGVRLGNPNGVLPYTVLISADGHLIKRRIGPFPSASYIAHWAVEN